MAEHNKTGAHEIKMIPIELIQPYGKNPRYNDEAVEYVKNSIQQFGFAQPIVVDKNAVIIAGHTRHKASKALGLEKVPVIVLDDLTEEEANAYRLADNKVAEFAEWDFGLLDEELNELAETNINMEDFGFFDEINKLEVEETEEEDEPEFYQVKFKLSPEQYEIVQGALQTVEPSINTYGNEDTLGNTFFALVEEWAERGD